MYTVTDIEDKGKGMLAMRDIQKGECIIAEPPLLVYDSRNGDTELIRTVCSLKKKEQKSFYSLHKQQSSSKSLEADIAQTNSLPLGKNSHMRGVFRVISRINHSCEHNADHIWNNLMEKEIIVANRDIPMGSEISICYAEIYLSRDFRRATLMASFGFLCNCGLCCSPDSREHDAGLARIKQCEDLILDYASSDPRRSIEYVNEALNLIKKFDVQSITSAFCYDGFQICAMHGDYKSAQKWADLLFDTYLDGDRGENYNRYLRYKNNPRSHERAGCAGICRTLSGPSPDLM